MKISVVTISFNQAQFLSACIDSVAAQEGPWEHILCDPGSTDGSRELVEARRDHFSHLVFEKDEGPADGLNRGFARATGDIFYYLNSDDIILPGAFEQARQAFKLYTDADVLYGDGLRLDQFGRVTRRMRSAPLMNRFIYLAGGGAVVQQATFIRNDAFWRVGGFNVANRACWDGELLADLAGAGSRLRHIRRIWGGFRIHDASISGGGDPRLETRYREERRRMFRDVYGRDPSINDRVAGAIVGFVNRVARGFA